jgi:LacI family transcriptional regulator
MAGYMEAMARAGLTPRVIEGAFTKASGHEAGAALATGSGRLDAVFAANDNMAIGAMLALQDAGLAVPDDVAIVGFDDIPLAGLVRPALTTLKIEIAGTGRNALDRLVKMISTTGDDARCEIVRPQLVVRASSHPDPADKPAGAASDPNVLSLEAEKL